MGRIHAPELEDERWFPAFLRDGLTAFLQVASEKTRLFDDAAPILTDVLARHGLTHIVDIGAGGGGSLVSLIDRLPAGTTATLTDLYPNVSAFRKAGERTAGRLRGMERSIDATDVPPELAGVRTVFNAFHHFRPALAKSVLADAARKKQPICVFEVVERRPATMAWIFFTPLAVLAFTPWSPGLDAKRLLFTYVVPLIPLGVWWDGMCSCLRGYSVDELRALVADIPQDDYRFTIAQTDKLPLRVTYLIGEPDRPTP